MSREDKARMRSIRDGLRIFADEIDELFTLGEEDAVGKQPAKENWTTADKAPVEEQEGPYLKDLKELSNIDGTKITELVVTGQIKTVFDLKSYVGKTGEPGLVYRIVLEDATGEMVAIAFDDMATKLKEFTIGQHLRITNTWMVKDNKDGKPELHIGKFAKIEVVE